MEEIKLHQFAEKLDLQTYSPRSIKTYCDDVERFFAWLSEHEGLQSLDEVNERQLSAYHAHLQYSKTAKGTYLATTTLHHMLYAVKLFYRFMHQERLIKHDYAHLITPPRQKRGLPKNVPGEQDIAAMLDSVKPTNLLDIRNRAILELLYATGIRNMELRLLTLEDLNLSERTLFIHGKGAKDRVVPLGSWVVPYLTEYLEAVRPKLLRSKKSDLLFVTKSGNEIPAENLCYIVRTRAKAAGITQRLNPHTMRHACATHMLRGGADIRYIQELLGHAELSTTQIYTHVDISMLKKAHKQFHPREKAGDHGN
jgi:integrase/recombinase XerD